MDEDDDWLSPPSQSQGGMTDPLVEQEYQRIASRYSDVREPNPPFPPDDH